MDIKEALTLIRINGHDLATELMSQSELVYRVGEECRTAESIFDQRTEDLKQIEAGVFAARKAGGDADKLATELTKGHPQRIAAWNAMAAAEQDLKQWRNVADAVKQKGYSLKELVTLHTVEYYALTPAGTGPRVGRERKDYTAVPADEPAAPRSRRRAAA